MKKIIKYLLIVTFLLEFAGQVPVEAKPGPPGSGEGDVAANILFLIDNPWGHFAIPVHIQTLHQVSKRNRKTT